MPVGLPLEGHTYKTFGTLVSVDWQTSGLHFEDRAFSNASGIMPLSSEEMSRKLGQ